MQIPVLEYKCSTTNEYIYVKETNEYNPESEINNISWYFYSKLNKLLMTSNFSVRMYYPSTMNTLIVDAGLQIKNIWGRYDKTPINEGSKLQIYDIQL